MSGIFPALPGATPTVTETVAVVKESLTTPLVPTLHYMDIIGLFLSIGFLLVFVAYILLTVFGKPVILAGNAGQSGKSLIFHFNTPKSAEIKEAKVSGEAFRYSEVTDGTVAAASDSILNINGKSAALTYAQFGMTIPVKILAAISVLVQSGIMNYVDLMDAKKGVVLAGYDFMNFKTFIKQNNESALIPLKIESAPDFTNENIVSDYTENDIMLRAQIDQHYDKRSGSFGQLLTVVVVIVLLVLASTVIK